MGQGVLDLAPSVADTIQTFLAAGRTGQITLHVKDGRILQVETNEVKRVTNDTARV